MLSEINEIVSSIKADEETKNAILQLIDLKTNSDMKEVLNKIENLSSKTDTEIKNLKWLIIGASTIIATLLTIIALKK
jgi:hypothetical protein